MPVARSIYLEDCSFRATPGPRGINGLQHGSAGRCTHLAHHGQVRALSECDPEAILRCGTRLALRREF